VKIVKKVAVGLGAVFGLLVLRELVGLVILGFLKIKERSEPKFDLKEEQ
jgi:hypothetical protein